MCEFVTRSFKKVKVCKNGVGASHLLNITFILAFIDAETEVISLAKRKSLAKRLDILTLGNEHQMCQALTAVERAMRKGRWVLLTNCHLATEWSKAFLEHLQVHFQ